MDLPSENRHLGVNESGGQSSTELYSVEGGRNTECNSVLLGKHTVDKVPTAFIHFAPCEVQRGGTMT
jgi:hypothetical protein